MNKTNIDQMTFKSQETVLNQIKWHENKSLYRKCLDLLNYEVEIPLSGLVVTFACWFALIGFNTDDEVYVYEYPIMIIESGGGHEIY